MLKVDLGHSEDEEEGPPVIHAAGIPDHIETTQFSHDKQLLIEHVRGTMQELGKSGLLHFYMIQVHDGATRLLTKALTQSTSSDSIFHDNIAEETGLDLLAPSTTSTATSMKSEILCFTPLSLHPKKFKRPGMYEEEHDVFHSSDLIIHVVGTCYNMSPGVSIWP